MGLVDKLTEVDEAIWKQYEKVTNYCNREYGWNKWDLANIANGGRSASLLGMGVYETIFGLNNGTMYDLAIGAVMGVLAVAGYNGRKKAYGSLEEKELKKLEKTGAAEPIQFNPYRPLFFGISIWATYIAGSVFFGDSQDTFLELNSYLGDNRTTIGLMYTTLSAYEIFFLSEKYFQDQIMTPPKKKKSVLKTLYEKLTGKIPAVPQLQPVKPNRYQSIDNVVGE